MVRSIYISLEEEKLILESTVPFYRKLSLGQLVAAIVSTVQTKRATLFTELLSQKMSVDTIGVSNPLQ